MDTDVTVIEHHNNDVEALLGKSTFYVEQIKPLSIVKPEHKEFFLQKKEEIQKVFEKTWIWRTDGQKRSILSDFHHPTYHSKFQQAMLEQKVQLDQALQLAKDFEIAKLDTENLIYDLEELDKEIEECTNDLKRKRLEVRKRKKEIELSFKSYELKNQQIAFEYRMKEVTGWEKLKESLYKEMKAQGLDDEDIYNKEKGEVIDQFFMYINMYVGVPQSTDSAEVSNLTSLVTFAVKQAMDYGLYDSLIVKCNPTQLAIIHSFGFPIPPELLKKLNPNKE